MAAMLPPVGGSLPAPQGPLLALHDDEAELQDDAVPPSDAAAPQEEDALQEEGALQAP